MTPPPLPTDEIAVEKVRTGQKIIIYAILLNLATIPIRFGIDSRSPLMLLALLVGIVTIILSIIGILRLSGGLGYSVPLRVVFSILMIVPLVSLIVLLILNAKATAFLRSAGLAIGLLGARKKST